MLLCRRVGNVWVYGTRARCVLGPSWRWLLVSLVLILVCTVVFTAYTNELTHMSLIVAVLAAATLTSLLACGLTNPGIVARGTGVSAASAATTTQGQQQQQQQPQQSPQAPPPHSLPRSQDTMDVAPQWWRVPCDGHNGTHDGQLYITMEQRWCASCRLYRPCRAVHCHYCDVCVHRRDHHCPWTGNCIGAGNYVFFFALVWLLSVLSGVVLFASIASLVVRTRALRVAAAASDGGGGDDARVRAYGSNFAAAVAQTYGLDVVLIVLSFVWLVLALALASYHSYLVMHNRTSYDALKHLPPCLFTHGSVLANVRQSLCYDAQRDDLFANDANRITASPPSPTSSSSSLTPSSPPSPHTAEQHNDTRDDDNRRCDDDDDDAATTIVIAT